MAPKTGMRPIGLLILLIGACVLQGCGFKLRGSQALPESLDTVVINAAQQHSPMVRALNDRLPVYQLKGVNASALNASKLEKGLSKTDTLAMSASLNPGSTVIISLQPESLERRLLSVFSSGQVAEYEMIFSVAYEVRFPQAEALSNTVIVSREYQDDPRQILAKSRELELIMQEMRDESADRIIRLLSNQYSLARSAVPQTPREPSNSAAPVNGSPRAN